MTAIRSMPQSEVINYKWSSLTRPFWFKSDVLRTECVIPPGFECDWESVPLIKGTSKVAGLIHDYLSRKDSVPVVSKKTAADVYYEFMRFRGTSWIKAQWKYWVVRYAPFYFHKHTVLENMKD